MAMVLAIHNWTVSRNLRLLFVHRTFKICASSGQMAYNVRANYNGYMGDISRMVVVFCCLNPVIGWYGNRYFDGSESDRNYY